MSTNPKRAERGPQGANDNGPDSWQRRAQLRSLLVNFVRDGKTFEEAKAILASHPDLAEWVKARPHDVKSQWDSYYLTRQAALRTQERRSTPETLNFVCAADVEPESVKWLWPGRLARGKLTIIAGDPSMGKSQISIAVAARLSTGDRWPDGGRAPKGRTIILSAEDAVNDTISPRLHAAEADLRRVIVLASVNGKEGRKRTFSLQADLAALGSKIAELGDVALVIIDPITSYMGDIDSHRTTDVRAVLEPLAEWASRMNVAVLAVSHPPKAAQAKAIHAVTGSLAFVAAARMVFLAIAEPESDRSLLLPVKNNLGRKADGLAYRIAQREIGDGVNVPFMSSSCIEWDREAVTITAEEAMRPERSKNPTVLEEAEIFLRNFLGLGPRSADDVKAAARAEGVSPATLKRAKGSLGIASRKADFGGGWVWQLPADASDFEGI